MFVASMVPLLFLFERKLVTFSFERKRTPKDRDAGTILIAIGTRKTPSLSRSFGICPGRRAAKAGGQYVKKVRYFMM
jgi:hypothetical protein